MFLLLLMFGCHRSEEVPSCDDVQATIDAQCSACHIDATLGDLDLTSVGAVVGVPSAESDLNLIEPGSAELSYLWHKVRNSHEDVGGMGTEMPPEGSGFSMARQQRSELEAWIEDGAVCEATPIQPQLHTTRRLSNVELANSLSTLLDVQPGALSLLPPDSHGFTFDRVVDSQTLSNAHLDAYYAVATESAGLLLGRESLESLSSACAGVALPPPMASAVSVTPGAGLTLGPEWAVGVDSADPTVGTSLYSPTPQASTSLTFPVDGAYTLSLELETSSLVDPLEVYFNGALVDVASMDGRGSVDVQVDAVQGAATLVYDLITVPEDHNLAVSFFRVTQEGPLDLNPNVTDRRTCAVGLVDDLGPRLFRRPLVAAERDRLLALYDSAEGANAYILVLTAMLANPNFLYLIEDGVEVEPGTFALDQWSLASRLSYALCEQPPDDELMAAAAAGQLDSAGLEAQARRLLDLPCGQEATARFMRQWLDLNQLSELNKSPEVFAGFDDVTRAGLVSESDRFIDEMIYGRSATLEEVLATSTAWPDPRSGWLMGLDPSTQQEVQLPSTRKGILSHPSVLAVTAPFDDTSPVHRGVFVLERLLCDVLPPPPAELNVAPPVPDPGLTTRERWAAHSDDPQCSECHQFIDPIGFGFEGFDGIGRYRTFENGQPIDTSSGIPTIGIADGELSDLTELTTALSTSSVVQHCFADHWLRSSLGRRSDAAFDTDSVDSVAGQLADNALKEGLIELVKTPAFLHRYETEVTP